MAVVVACTWTNTLGQKLKILPAWCSAVSQEPNHHQSLRDLPCNDSHNHNYHVASSSPPALLLLFALGNDTFTFSPCCPYPSILPLRPHVHEPFPPTPSASALCPLASIIS